MRCSLDRSPELEESLFRIALSHQRPPGRCRPCSPLLERWLERGDLPDRPRSCASSSTAWSAETQGREPAVHDLAREVRYRVFDRPLLLAARERIYAAAASDLARLAADPGHGGERGELIRALVECTQPLHRLLSQRYASVATAPTSALRAAMLEIMVRRYYRIRELGGDRALPPRGADLRASPATSTGAPTSTSSPPMPDRDRLAWSRRGGAEPRRRGARRRREVVADLYLWRRSETGAERRCRRRDRARCVAAAGRRPGLSRVAVTVSGPAGSQHFTFRREDGPFQEEEVYRGIHPMLALRLQLWRLRNFRLDRLPAPEESTSSTASPTRTRATSGSSPWPRCATSRRCATRPAGRIAHCPSSSTC